MDRESVELQEMNCKLVPIDRTYNKDFRLEAIDHELLFRLGLTPKLA
jgi:hypothetical protein